ncbi:MAG TPA: murein transglycosylase, partial [Actinoplanes sp.]|nr:murein transglycosylase [Actinoplanes sp.]
DPNDIDDAALAAGNYLCGAARDMAKPDDWWEAILSYNDVRPYAQKVFTEADSYGRRSRT